MGKYFEDDDTTPSSIAFPCVAACVCCLTPYHKLEYESKKGAGETLLIVLVEDVTMVTINVILFMSVDEPWVGPVLLLPFIALVSSALSVTHTLWLAAAKMSSCHCYPRHCCTGVE